MPPITGKPEQQQSTDWRIKWPEVLKCQLSVNADLNRNVFRCRLNCSVFEIQQISVGRRFHWCGTV